LVAVKRRISSPVLSPGLRFVGFETDRIFQTGPVVSAEAEAVERTRNARTKVNARARGCLKENEGWTAVERPRPISFVVLVVIEMPSARCWLFWPFW
jgi:hypothetical protein